MRPFRNPRRGEKGVALIYVAFFLLVFLWFVSLAVDVGRIMAARTELQAAADAAALAGASAIDPTTGEINADSARARAAITAAANSAFENEKTSVIIDPDVDVDFPTPQRCRVRVYRDSTHANPLLLHFAQVLGISSVGISADATAEAQAVNNQCDGLAPFAPSEPPNGIPYDSSCTSSYILKVGAQGSQQGNFQLLDYGECPAQPGAGGGGQAVEYYIVNGYKCCVEIGDEIELETEPGNKVGPVRTGLRERWDADTDQTHSCYQDYTGNGSRVFLCPVIESFDVNGKSMVRVTKFAAFFIKERPTGNFATQGVPGQFIKYVAPGDVGAAPPESTGVFTLHLVE